MGERKGKTGKSSTLSDPRVALRQFFGIDSFRPGQRPLVDAILSGRDVLGILPTGGGKSICYQLPALMLPGMTLVISPLISLMNDQVRSLRKRGIPAALLSSEQTHAQQKQVIRDALEGRIRLLYLAPERLGSAAFRRFSVLAPEAPCRGISLVCIDEAHCISRWGEEFRPSYREIPAFLNLLQKTGKRPVTAAFTATAAPEIRKDILEYAGLIHPFILAAGFDRPNLYYEVRRTRRKSRELLALLRRYSSLSGIVYCRTRASADSVARFLRSRQIDAVSYHAGLSKKDRKAAQDAWLEGKIPVIAATNAFGMGIDKPDVRFVIHYHMPCDPESYYQEAGRAGRDGNPADCILLYSPRDVSIARFFIAKASSPDVRRRMNASLSAMRAYVSGRHCLRASLLRYYGEHTPDWCGKCSVCIGQGPFPAIPVEGKEDHELFRSLVSVRKRLADERGLTPCKIFSDSELHAIAARKPLSLPEMAGMEGISLLRVKKYGVDFLAEVHAWYGSDIASVTSRHSRP